MQCNSHILQEAHDFLVCTWYQGMVLFMYEVHDAHDWWGRQARDLRTDDAILV